MSLVVQIETSSPRPGRRFEPVQERALHAAATAACHSLPGAARGLVVIPEFSGPIGIPDFTAFIGDAGDLIRRQRLSVPATTNEIDAGILSVAHVQRPRTAASMAQSLNWPLSTIAGRLRGLVLRGSLLEPTPGRFVRPAELSARGRLYAVEAKVDDWRSGLRQVRTYRVWADAYVLVMAKVAERALGQLTDEVTRDRGGLVVDGEWILRPRIGRLSAHRKLQAWEMFANASRCGLEAPALAPGVHA